MLVNILLMPHIQTAMVVKHTLTIGLNLGFYYFLTILLTEISLFGFMTWCDMIEGFDDTEHGNSTIQESIN